MGVFNEEFGQVCTHILACSRFLDKRLGIEEPAYGNNASFWYAREGGTRTNMVTTSLRFEM
jgi:hypothetical protein